MEKKVFSRIFFHSVSQKGKNDPENKTISSFFLFHSISHMEKGFTDEKSAILNFGEKNYSLEEINIVTFPIGLGD